MSRVTVPLAIEGNRGFIDVTLGRAGEGALTARFWVDTGGGGFLLTESLARKLGVHWNETFPDQGEELGHAAALPQVSVGGYVVEVDPSRAFIVLGKDTMVPPAAPGHADGLFPGHLLARHHVIFDYPRRAFTIANPGSVTPVGEPLPMPVSDQSGFPRTEVVVDGSAYAFLLDTGASFTMISEATLKEWATVHPDWERHDGAHGEAATLGGQTLETMVVPSAAWGPFEFAGFGVVSQREGTFERWMSSMMAAPIVGALGGNVLNHFRIELDYANEVLYVSQPRR